MQLEASLPHSLEAPWGLWSMNSRSLPEICYQIDLFHFRNTVYAFLLFTYSHLVWQSIHSQQSIPINHQEQFVFVDLVNQGPCFGTCFCLGGIPFNILLGWVSGIVIPQCLASSPVL